MHLLPVVILDPVPGPEHPLIVCWAPGCCAQVPRPFASRTPGKMSYEDFVWFILSEEDKTSETAQEYWFK